MDWMRRRRAAGKILLLAVLPAMAFLLAVSVGRYPAGIAQLPGALHTLLTGGELDPAQLTLVRLRLPRIILAMLVGGALALSGAAYQGLFQNPVVSPDLLGASSGASFGASLAILLGAGSLGVQAASFCAGVLAVALAAGMDRLLSRRSVSAVHLILCGMLVSSLFNALLSFVKFAADPETKLPAITFWLMGSFSGASQADLRVFWLFLPACALLLMVRWRLNVLAMGDEEARMLGVNVRASRYLIIACATLLTSLSVSVSGNIGWVGLVAPHFARMLVGADYGKLLPASMALGGAFLLLVDTAARALLTVELPLSVLTAVIGAPFFFLLLLRGKRGFL